MYGLSDIVIQDICSVLKKHDHIDEAIIFGSRAKGNYHEGSDIDLAIKGHHISYEELMDINIQIDDLGLLYGVDVINYNEKTGTPIGEHIDRVGQIFYKKT
ncbi:MAG: nucleotidyltransferase domain-containing protein [Bacteroidaceae bacterium]|nr:nucleotidyltransferase domain-containing protein [Bacteroidaceae bacterium]